MKRMILYFMFMGFLVGCKGYVPRGFMPPPQRSEQWVKYGAQKRDINIALLECGFPSPDYMKEYPATIDEIAWASYCMENDGFHYDSDRKDDAWRRMCEKEVNGVRVEAGLAACQADALPPRRDINRRLNSQFCKDHPNVFACK
jgi:hypothetical protein